MEARTHVVPASSLQTVHQASFKGRGDKGSRRFGGVVSAKIITFRANETDVNPSGASFHPMPACQTGNNNACDMIAGIGNRRCSHSLHESTDRETWRSCAPNDDSARHFRSDPRLVPRQLPVLKGLNSELSRQQLTT